MKVKILSAISSVGWSGKKYGPFEADQIADLPSGLVQRLVKQGLAAEVIEEPKTDEQTEARLRKIAKTQGYDENSFLREYGRLISEGQPEMDALSQAMELFEKGAYKAEKELTLADFAPEKPEGEGKPGTAVEPEESPRTTEEVGGGAGPRIDPELAGWLSSKGFTLGPEGVAFTRTEKLETGDVVKLQVDFSDTPKGARYGYRLNLQSDPPEWRSDSALHDHPLLLQFKRFRDDLLTQREGAMAAPKAAPPEAEPAEVPTGEGTKLALLPPGEAEAAEVERKDEAQIVTELRGEIKARVLSEYFYDFTHQGRRVVGLSYAGVKAIVRKLGSIKVLDLKVEEKPDSWVVIAKARDERRNLEAYGPGWQAKRIRLKSGQLVDDPFALQKAVGKAQRNAFRHFIEEKIIAEAYRAWLEEREK